MEGNPSIWQKPTPKAMDLSPRIFHTGRTFIITKMESTDTANTTTSGRIRSMRSDMEMLARAGMMAANTTMLIKPLAWAFWRRFLGTTPSWVKITPSTSPRMA